MCVPLFLCWCALGGPNLLPFESVSFSTHCMLTGILYNDIYFSFKKAPKCKSVSSSGTQLCEQPSKVILTILDFRFIHFKYKVELCNACLRICLKATGNKIIHSYCSCQVLVEFTVESEVHVVTAS